MPRTAISGRPAAIQPMAAPEVAVPNEKTTGAAQVWPVEQGASFESYSNGLRIDNQFATGNHPRSYRAFPVSGRNAASGEFRTEPAGIVFHTTESLQLPFEPGQNATLQRVAEELLHYVKRKRCYNFVVDRFGRVFRVVRETDAAEHAGYSLWSDDQRLYVNLNESFLGIAVETRTAPGQTAAAVTAAQVRALAMLTEMLRSRYRIRAENCVTHAQVSVNPTRMLAGYHMDWASSFPYEAIGLPNNYARPVSSIAIFGFQYDASYAAMAGSRLLEGANLAAQELAGRAAACGISLAAYRMEQRRSYRLHVAAMNGAAVSHEGE